MDEDNQTSKENRKVPEPFDPFLVAFRLMWVPRALPEIVGEMAYHFISKS